MGGVSWRIRTWEQHALGLVVEGHLVTVDHSVKELLISSVEGNPKVSVTDTGMRVLSVFTRIKSSGKSRRDRHVLGDNCHMLYALKQKRRSGYEPCLYPHAGRKRAPDPGSDRRADGCRLRRLHAVWL